MFHPKVLIKKFLHWFSSLTVISHWFLWFVLDDPDITPRLTPQFSDKASRKPTRGKGRVKRSSNDAGKRVWDKEHACMYCSKTFTYITKHYFRKHKTEKDVIEIKSQPLGSKQRAKLLLLLRNKGDFNYSHEALRTNSGRVIPVRRPVRGKPEHDMVPCEHCFGMFNKHALWRHDKTCRLKPAGCGSDAPSKRRRLVAASSMLLPATQGIHEGLRKNVLNTS